MSGRGCPHRPSVSFHSIRLLCSSRRSLTGERRGVDAASVLAIRVELVAHLSTVTSRRNILSLPLIPSGFPLVSPDFAPLLPAIPPLQSCFSLLPLLLLSALRSRSSSDKSVASLSGKRHDGTCGCTRRRTSPRAF